MVEVILPDGTAKQAEKKETWLSFIDREIGSGLARSTVAVDINGVIQDAEAVVESGKFNAVTADSHTGQEIIRHSTSHLMADAVTRLFPGTKVAIGPSIEDGFYYDFDSPHQFTEDDIPLIEKKMKEIASQKYPFRKEILKKEEARKMFRELDEKYKLELIEDIEDDEVSLYKHGKFSDLCRGPHVPHTGFLKHFRLLSIAGAYWRGDEHKKMLQRIYGTAFSRKKALKEYLKRLEEARKRDHRLLGKKFDLFHTSDLVGSGLVCWTPRAGTIRTVMENFSRKEHYRNGYEFVYTPHIGRKELWEISGHLGFYKEGMYSPMDIDGEDYYVKPMNCPFHIALYKRKKWSYRDLPLKWAEFGTVYRYERSGTLNGMKRARGFTQDDAHVFCRMDQLEQAITDTVDFSVHILESFGFNELKLFLSTRPEKFVGDVEAWSKAEESLQSSLENSGRNFILNKKDGAFYGPKIDINVTDSIGRDWQLSTIQVDFQLPERFDMSYTGADGEEHRPIMIHRALLGSLERFFGVLLEHFNGEFPFWLAPEQVVIITVADRHEKTAEKLEKILKNNNIRVAIDNRNEKTGYKIRSWSIERVPYVIVIGDKEENLKILNVRDRSGEEKQYNISDFIDKIFSENKEGAYF